jgi:glycosyltransferase involved in cell wall biosynthesis
MGVDQDTEHTQGFVILNEPHPSHVCSKVVNELNPRNRLLAGWLVSQVETEVFDVGELLVPFIERFDVNSPNMPAALPAKVRDQIAADKPSGATHKYLFVFHNNPILAHDPRLLQTNITEIPWPSSLFFLERSASWTKLSHVQWSEVCSRRMHQNEGCRCIRANLARQLFVTRSLCTRDNDAGAPAPREDNPRGRKRRILMLGYFPPPYFGPSVAYQALLRSEFAQRFDVTFINLSVVQSIRELESFRLGKLFKLAKFFLVELWYLLTRRFDACCYPISFSRSAFLKDAVLVGLARAFGVPTVLFAHGTGVQRFRGSLAPRLQRLFDTTLGNATAVLVIAESLRSEFDGLVAPERVFVVTIGIEPQPSLPEPQQRAGGLTILYLGALVKAKGIFDLLEAMPLVLARRPDSRLVAAGEWFRPNEELTAQEFVRKHHLDGAVNFVGPVHGESKWRLLRSADVFAFPPYSSTEAFGIVLLEAMQAGAPIVATRGGARGEVIDDGINGLLVNEQDPADLAAKILQLADDPGLRERMGKANLERFASYYTHEHYGQRMIEVFDQLSARHR